jgi:hypothetical protein
MTTGQNYKNIPTPPFIVHSTVLAFDMIGSKTLVIAGSVIAVAGLIIALASLNPVSQAKKVEEEHAFMQIDIANTYQPAFNPGFFKLLADFTDMRVVHGHVAISNIPCDGDGVSSFAVLAANANVGTGTTQYAAIPLNADNLVGDVSATGTVCTYHVDVHGDDYEFPVTDFALANVGTEAQTIDSTSSATIHADVVE